MNAFSGKEKVVCSIGPKVFATTSAWGTQHLIMDFPSAERGVITDLAIRFEKKPAGDPSGLYLYVAERQSDESGNGPNKFKIRECTLVSLPPSLVAGSNADGSPFVFPSQRLELTIPEPG